MKIQFLLMSKATEPSAEHVCFTGRYQRCQLGVCVETF